MNLNDVLMRQSFFINLALKNGSKELSKELKFKIINNRTKLNKYRKEFEEFIQESIKEFKTEEYKELSAKENKTEKELEDLKDMTSKLQNEVDGFVNKVLSEEKDFDLKFTDEELSELIDINSGIDATVNGVKLKTEDFLEQVYIMFS